MISIVIKDIEHIREAAREFIEHIGDRRVFAFYGKMGAGKTTFVKAICEELGVTLNTQHSTLLRSSTSISIASRS